jgi:hypothetical protein
LKKAMKVRAFQRLVNPVEVKKSLSAGQANWTFGVGYSGKF